MCHLLGRPGSWIATLALLAFPRDNGANELQRVFPGGLAVRSQTKMPITQSRKFKVSRTALRPKARCSREIWLDRVAAMCFGCPYDGSLLCDKRRSLRTTPHDAAELLHEQL